MSEELRKEAVEKIARGLIMMPDCMYDVKQLIEKGYEAGYKARAELDRWVPCSDRLPEEHALVLCTFCGIVSYGKFNGHVWVVNDEPDFSLVKTDIISFVTHWMPMPAAPITDKQ
jgi:hypothetical protein